MVERKVKTKRKYGLNTHFEGYRYLKKYWRQGNKFNLIRNENMKMESKTLSLIILFKQQHVLRHRNRNRHPKIIHYVKTK